MYYYNLLRIRSAGADATAVDARGDTPVNLMGKDERPKASEGFSGDPTQEEDDQDWDEYDDEYEDEEED